MLMGFIPQPIILKHLKWLAKYIFLKEWKFAFFYLSKWATLLKESSDKESLDERDTIPESYMVFFSWLLNRDKVVDISQF